MKIYSDDIAKQEDVTKNAATNAQEIEKLSAHMEPMCHAIEEHDTKFMGMGKRCDKLAKQVKLLWAYNIVTSLSLICVSVILLSK